MKKIQKALLSIASGALILTQFVLFSSCAAEWDAIIHQEQSSSSESVPVIPACEHLYKAEILTEPTCYSEGERKDVCRLCGQTEYSTIPKVEHELLFDWAKEPSADRTYTTLVHGCKYNCKQHPLLEEKVALQVSKKVETSCTEDGIEAYGAIFIKDGIKFTHKYEDRSKALGHSVEEWEITPPTETTTGSAKGVCTTCHEEIDIPLPVLSSTSYIRVTILDPDCENPSLETYRYQFASSNYLRSKEISFEVNAPALGHEWGEWLPATGDYNWIRYCKVDHNHIQVTKSDTKPED